MGVSTKTFSPKSGLLAVWTILLSVAVSNATMAAPATQQTGGVGIRLRQFETCVMVISIVSDGPGAVGGVRPGDIVEAIGGAAVNPADPVADAVQRLSGQEGTTVKVTLQRRGQTLQIDLKREPILTILNRGAAKGDACALKTLGDFHRTGRLVAQDQAEAERLYHKAADAGDADAIYTLAILAERANNEQPNADIFKLLNKSAEAGSTDAMNELGHFFVDLPAYQDYPKAVAWYRRAYDLGDSKAAYNLGYMTEKGLGTPSNIQDAYTWYLRSAKRGNAQGMFNTAVCYRTGEGVKANRPQARKWFQRAADKGLEPAKQALERMRQEDLVNIAVSILTGADDDETPTNNRGPSPADYRKSTLVNQHYNGHNTEAEDREIGLPHDFKRDEP